MVSCMLRRLPSSIQRPALAPGYTFLPSEESTSLLGQGLQSYAANKGEERSKEGRSPTNEWRVRVGEANGQVWRM